VQSTHECALSVNQIEFVNLIVNHLTEHGAMEAAMLYESPFTDLTKSHRRTAQQLHSGAANPRPSQVSKGPSVA
jgi:type I site-specific restriction endonuclease